MGREDGAASRGSHARRGLRRGEIGVTVIAGIARRIAAFHARAAAGTAIAACGRFDVVAANARENLAQAAVHVGVGAQPRLCTSGLPG